MLETKGILIIVRILSTTRQKCYDESIMEEKKCSYNVLYFEIIQWCIWSIAPLLLLSGWGGSVFSGCSVLYACQTPMAPCSQCASIQPGFPSCVPRNLFCTRGKDPPFDQVILLLFEFLERFVCYKSACCCAVLHACLLMKTFVMSPELGGRPIIFFFSYHKRK